jgi:hypothetical protein
VPQGLQGRCRGELECSLRSFCLPLSRHPAHGLPFSYAATHLNAQSHREHQATLAAASVASAPRPAGGMNPTPVEWAALSRLKAHGTDYAEFIKAQGLQGGADGGRRGGAAAGAAAPSPVAAAPPAPAPPAVDPATLPPTSAADAQARFAAAGDALKLFIASPACPAVRDAAQRCRLPPPPPPPRYSHYHTCAHTSTRARLTRISLS